LVISESLHLILVGRGVYGTTYASFVFGALAATYKVLLHSDSGPMSLNALFIPETSKIQPQSWKWFDLGLPSIKNTDWKEERAKLGIRE